MSQSRRLQLLVVAVVVGAATFAWAQVRTADARVIPYQGVLERDGVAHNGPITARFGLFGTETADTTCVVTNSCPLWSEEQIIDVVDGRFSVLLGDSGSPRKLTSAVLQTPQLFLAVAFQDVDGAFVLLGGTQEIVGAPLLQPGSVTRTSFAAGTLFSANIGFNFETGDYIANNVSPPGWMAFFGEADDLGVSFGLNTFGAAVLRCTASPRSFDPRVITIREANPGVLRFGTFFPNGGVAPADFTVMCHGF